jgi:outer membrane protein assembly factor BamB
MLWNLKVFGKRCCSTPLVVGDVAIGTCGSGGGGNELAAVRIPNSPAQKPTEIYRISRAAPYVPTPAIKGDRMFTIDDKGIASCLNVKTGEVIWSQRIGGNFGASPVILGDKLLLISLTGQATLLRAADQFEKLGEIDLGGPVGATPAFAEGRLLIRVDREIRCLDGKAI